MSIVILAGLAVWALVVVCAIAVCVEAGRADGRAEDRGQTTAPAPVTGRFRAVA